MSEITDKNKITIQNPADDEFERKIQELQAKAQKKDEDEN